MPVGSARAGATGDSPTRPEWPAEDDGSAGARKFQEFKRIPSVALQYFLRSDKHPRMEASQKSIEAALAQIFLFLHRSLSTPRPIPRTPGAQASFIWGGLKKKTKHHQQIWFHTNHVNFGQRIVK